MFAETPAAGHAATRIRRQNLRTHVGIFWGDRNGGKDVDE